MLKRGEAETRPLMYVAEAVIALLVFLAMFNYIKGVASNSLFEQNFMARDTALLTDSIYAAPGKMHVTYDTTVYPTTVFGIQTSPQRQLQFSFEDSKVFVYGDILTTLYPVSYPFGKDTHLEFRALGKLAKPPLPEEQPQQENLLFQKNSEELNVTVAQNAK